MPRRDKEKELRESGFGGCFIDWLESSSGCLIKVEGVSNVFAPNNKKDWRRILAMAQAAGGAGTCITNEAIDRTSRRLMIPSEIDGRHALDLSRD